MTLISQLYHTVLADYNLSQLSVQQNLCNQNLHNPTFPLTPTTLGGTVTTLKYAKSHSVNQQPHNPTPVQVPLSVGLERVPCTVEQLVNQRHCSNCEVSKTCHSNTIIMILNFIDQVHREIRITNSSRHAGGHVHKT